MASIPMPGLGSGLDIRGMSSGLANAEYSSQIDNVTTKTRKTSSKISALGSVSSSLNNFGSSLEAMTLKSTVDNRISYPEADRLVDVTSSSRASQGSYSIEVMEISSKHRIRTEAFDEGDVFEGAITLLTMSGEFNVSMAAGSTIYDVAEALNEATDDVNAVIINDGTGEVLSISSNNSGIEGEISINTINSTTNPASKLDMVEFNSGATSTMTEVSIAKDSKIKLNGVEVSSPDTTFNDAISGLEISIRPSFASDNLNKEQQFEIFKDNSGLKYAVNDFISNYNSLVDKLKGLTEYDAEKDEASVFTGDADMRILSQKLSTAMSTPIDGISGLYNSLYSVGIKSHELGGLEIDYTMLDEAIEADPEAVKKLLFQGVITDSTSVTVNTEQTDEIPTFREEFTILSLPEVGNTAIEGNLLTDPRSTALTITDGVKLMFDGDIIASALGEGGDDLIFDNYIDFISQINEDLAGLELPLIATLDVDALSETDFLSRIIFTQNSPNIGDFSIDPSGFIPPGFGTVSIDTPAVEGVLDYNDQDYNYMSGFEIPDLGVELSIDYANIEVGDEVEVRADKGYGYILGELIKDYTDSDGLLESKRESLESTKSRYEELQLSLYDKRDRLEGNYLKEFQQLDMTLVRMRSQADSLSAQLDQINANSIAINN